MSKFIVFFFLAFFMISCEVDKQIEPIKLIGEAQGTYYSIIYYDDENRDFQHEIDSILNAFDQSVSLWVPNSILSRINQNDTIVMLDDHFRQNFELAREVAIATEGGFDFTVAPLVRAWGFSFDNEKKVDKQIIDSLLPIVNYRNVQIENGSVMKANPRITFDFNAIAQGYSVDLIGEWIENKGVRNYLIDIGGEVKGEGNKSDNSYWKVGIEKPTIHKSDARDLKAVVELKDASVATSGNYRKFYEEDGIRYSHTIDPKTGYPVQHSLLSVSVLTNSTALADAYATAFMVWGFEKSKSFVETNPDLDAFFIYSDDLGNYQTYATDGFRKQITNEFE